MFLLAILGRRLGQIILTVVLVALLIFGLMRAAARRPGARAVGRPAPPTRRSPGCITSWAWTARSPCSSGSS
ncbi:MAG: hypothetical protein WDN49_13450 [Acetobacteraceae bacterium]